MEYLLKLNEKKTQGSYTYVMLASGTINLKWSPLYIALYHLDLTIHNIVKLQVLNTLW